MAAISDVSVQDEISVPSMFSFTFHIGGANGGFEGVDLDLFKPGDEITIFMGIGSARQLISGDITAIEPSFSTSSASATIRGFDRMYWLKFGTRVKSYEMLSDSEIVVDVAKTSGLPVTPQGSADTINAYVLQDNISNYQFLLDRCRHLDYELLMAGTTLVFRPCAEGLGALRTLAYPRDLGSVDLNLKLPTSGASVTAIGYDAETNTIITAVAETPSQQDKMGGQQTGYQAAARFPDSGVTIECPNISDPAALQAVAEARYQELLKDFIEGQASLAGDSALVAGVNVKFSGLSARFDGTYYITSSTHRYDESTGYQCEIRVRRTGL
ncbi:phage late control D family protein [Undibacterium sp. Di26W]|uniref:phage late control D family protein n=1 Tax=Undibacterium sp. Di26W TaxID=3413035 RepID=UPI003BF0FE20